MKHPYPQIGILLLMSSIYGLLGYLILSQQQIVDFSAFYSSALALIQGENPYVHLSAPYLSSTALLFPNLNPPIVLWIFSLLAGLSYSNALLIWFILSFILGLIGAGLAFYHAFSVKFLKKNYLYLYLVYLSSFPVLMNTAILQFGSLLLFFIMLGYHFYLKNRDWLAGILWGLIIAMKFFPALLFFYVLKQGRFRVFCAMFISFLVVCLIPLVFYGPSLYIRYYSMMSQVLWYADGWNASIYGFIFRLFFAPGKKNLVPINLLYGFLFFISLLWYLKKIDIKKSKQVNHQSFCLSLVMMLLMSPLGWIYYFPALVLPLMLSWARAAMDVRDSKNTMLLWLLCLFLLNIPLDYARYKYMPHILGRISFFSCPFYGLILLAYLLGQRKDMRGQNEINFHEAIPSFMLATRIIFIFGLFVPTLCFIMRLFRLDLHSFS